MITHRKFGARTVLIAMSMALLVPLSGCVSLFLPSPESTQSVPTGEKVSPELEPFYSQVLTWSRCEGGFQCATVNAPMDWSDPAGIHRPRTHSLHSDGHEHGLIARQPRRPRWVGLRLHS